jgi:hypothetical protein
MKTRPSIGILAFLGVVTLCFATDPSGKDRPPKGESCIQFPGSHLEQPKLDKIIKVLQNDRYQENYRVRVWDSGKMSREIGTMKINKAELSETDNYAKNSGLTSVTIQVGICNFRMMGCSPNCEQFYDADHLVDEISDVLKKYK